ncbi:putative metallophosphoesterase [Acorus calamus]|uniref:Metallophosphoesterase n=1 Tax=Acorus calamus TaxID=4465 RepID=A0AAV9D108_ACOCL|nr:putative metallophosphoesterase [Acorus calamus]
METYEIKDMGLLLLLLFFFFFFSSSLCLGHRSVIDVEGGPESVVWVVQLSDLHFSVHYPERASEFKKLVGPALSMINPSLVFITGDLTAYLFSKEM